MSPDAVHTNRHPVYTDPQTCSDCSGQELWKSIASGGTSVDYGLSRFWVHPYTTETELDPFPFLFIHSGSARLSGSEFGAALIKDASGELILQSLNCGGGVSSVLFAPHEN